MHQGSQQYAVWPGVGDLPHGCSDTHWNVGTGSPSTILSGIIIGLVGELYFFPALHISAQGERLSLCSLGCAGATPRSTGTNLSEGLTWERVASPGQGTSSLLPPVFSAPLLSLGIHFHLVPFVWNAFYPP